MLAVGDAAPSFALADIATGSVMSDPWRDGQVALAFFKVTCPVCQMAAPKVSALAASGVWVVGVGEDPPNKLAAYRDRFGQNVPTLSEPPPYRVSDAYGVVSVPSLVLVDQDGTIRDAVGAWDRDAWNRLATEAGATAPISTPADGLPAFRPG
ncbi:MAG: TlpA family protein disulfide reductase [Acidimicrobiales bacterium]